MKHKLAACLLAVMLTPTFAAPSLADWNHDKGNWSDRRENAPIPRYEAPRYERRDFHENDAWRHGYWHHARHGGRVGWWWIAGDGWHAYGRRMSSPPPRYVVGAPVYGAPYYAGHASHWHRQ